MQHIVLQSGLYVIFNLTSMYLYTNRATRFSRSTTTATFFSNSSLLSRLHNEARGAPDLQTVGPPFHLLGGNDGEALGHLHPTSDHLGVSWEAVANVIVHGVGTIHDVGADHLLGGLGVGVGDGRVALRLASRVGVSLKVFLGFGLIAVGLHLVDVEDGGEALTFFEGGVGGDRLGGLLGWEPSSGEDIYGGHL